MKNCHRWMILCVVIALAIIFVLPAFGVPLGGASLLIPLLMIGCCVLPMLFMLRSNASENGGSCCAKKEGHADQRNKDAAQGEKGKSGSCH